MTFIISEFLNFRRKIAGKYGGGVGVNLGIAWPTNEDLKQIKEYEKIANPFTLQEMVENKRKIREDERQRVQKRYKTFLKKILSFILTCNIIFPSGWQILRPRLAN